MLRFIIFADSRVDFAIPLLDAFLREIESRPNVTLIGICDTASRQKHPPSRTHKARGRLTYLLKCLFNPSRINYLRAPRFVDVSSVAKTHGHEVMIPPTRDINDPDFVRALREEYQPTVAIVLGCLQIFGRDLLATIPRVVNYHNAYLPNYRGLGATAWSLYHGEKTSGYSYHDMDEEIDSGPVLLQRELPIHPGAGPAQVERAKIDHATRDAGQLLDLLCSGFEGSPQPTGGTYFSARDRRELREVDDPSTLTAEELFRRLRCFAPIQIRMGDVTYPVTALREVGRWPRKFSFTTRDGVRLHPYRVNDWPTWLYRLARKLWLD